MDSAIGRVPAQDTVPNLIPRLLKFHFRNELPVPSLAFHEGAQVVNVPMRDYSPRSSHESDNVPWSKAVTCRAVRTMIGQELRARYEVPQDLPHEMLTLLLQLNEHDEEASSRASSLAAERGPGCSS